jgi:hypothetical protein
MPTFHELLQAPSIDLDAVARHLDGLTHEQRVREVRQVGGRAQARLYAACGGRGGLDLDYFVPPHVPDGTIVRHFGKNSLPLFSSFEKPMARPSNGDRVLWGWNVSPVEALVGPGHFVTRVGPEPGEMYVDYYSVPPERLDGAPALKPNDAGISNIVYGNMIDVMRRVSAHVSIGRAIKKGKETGNYFLLCRDGASDAPIADAQPAA